MCEERHLLSACVASGGRLDISLAVHRARKNRAASRLNMNILTCFIITCSLFKKVRNIYSNTVSSMSLFLLFLFKMFC